jgi:hypothetical protein
MRVAAVLAFLLTILAAACAGEPEPAGPDAGEPSQCERYCTWEHDLTGVSIEGCVAECEIEECADCCASTPQWPECQ